MAVKNFSYLLFALALYSAGSLFPCYSEAMTKQQVIAEYIGAEGEVAELDELFGTNVTLQNHYLSWETKYGSRSLDIEKLTD